MRDADHNGASIGEEIVDAIRYGDAGGIGAEIMIVDEARGQVPARPVILEIADQLALLGVDANNGETAALESVAKITQVKERDCGRWRVSCD